MSEPDVAALTRALVVFLDENDAPLYGGIHEVKTTEFDVLKGTMILTVQISHFENLQSTKEVNGV